MKWPRISKRTIRVIKSFFVTFLVFSWLITGYPTIWITPTFRFPPKIKEAKAADTGYKTSGANAAITSSAGDNNGIETTPTLVNANDSVFATDASTGTGVATDGCTTFPQAEDDQHDFYNFGFDGLIPAGSTINGIEVPTDGKADTSTGVNIVCVGLSWNAGTNWTAAKATSDWQAAETATTLGGSADTWGRTWSVSEFNNANFRLRVMSDPASSTARTFSYDYLAVRVYYTAPTTTIADGVNPSNSSIGPGASVTDLDAFTLIDDAGTDTMTAATVTLGPAGAFNNIAQVDITDNTNVAKCTAATGLTSNTVSMTGCSAGVTTSAATYKIRITPKTHANMPAPPGASYDTTGTVTAFTTTNAQAGTDAASATVTVDNASPNGATSVSGTAGDTKVTLNWTASSSTDFNTTSGSVIYRWTGSTAGSEVPAEGSTATIGAANGTATTACVVSSAISAVLSKIDGTGGSAECTTTALTNGQAYTYKAFQRDTNGNYDAGVSIGTFTPSAASSSFTQNKYRWYYDNDLADPTVAWGSSAIAENTAITQIPVANDPPDSSQELRLRVNYTVNTASLPISSNYFKLEYKAGTDGSCTTGSWTDVGTGAWVYATSTVTDGSNIAAALSDTTTGKGEQYAKSKPTALNHVAANTTENIEYDFHIIGTSAAQNTTYSFRVVGTNSAGSTETVFDAYTNCPTLTTEPGTGDLLRHGNIFNNGSEKGFYWTN